MLRRILISAIALTLLVLTVGGITGFNIFKNKMIAQFFATMKQPATPVSVSEVITRDWTPGIEAIGTATAAQGTDLAVEAPGVVRDILFKANDRVAEGQLLVQIDDRTERADLASARAALELAETNLTRARELQSRGVSASTTLDQAVATATEARSAVAKLEAVLETKRLTAPFDGMIGIPQIEPGQFVTAGPPFASLQDRDHMRVDFTLSEQQARIVRAGQKVEVATEDGMPLLQGEITGIEPKIDPNSRLVTLRADLPEAESALTPGQFVTVRVILPTETGVIALPQTVVSSNLYGDSVYVLRHDDSESEEPRLIARQVFVTLGRRSDGLVEIVNGLEAGDFVVNAGQNRLTSGAEVIIDNALSPDPNPPATEAVYKAFNMTPPAAPDASAQGN